MNTPLPIPFSINLYLPMRPVLALGLTLFAAFYSVWSGAVTQAQTWRSSDLALEMSAAVTNCASNGTSRFTRMSTYDRTDSRDNDGNQNLGDDG